jgi:hypothetical protein
MVSTHLYIGWNLSKLTYFNAVWLITRETNIRKGAAHRNICSKIGNIMVEGAAHRNIKFNIAVRCTFKTRLSHHCYKYYGALHLKFL